MTPPSRYARLLETESTGLGARLAQCGTQTVEAALIRGENAERVDIAANLLAPMLVGYALWVVRQARKRDVKRLYFVARDGQVMMRVAAPLLASIAPELECRYLYTSRQPLMLATSAYDDDVLSEWTRVATDFTLRSTLARVALTPDDLASIRPDLLIPRRGDFDAALPAVERAALSKALRTPPLLDRVMASAATAAQITTDYFAQEGLTDQTRSALVDAGWIGNTARAVDILVRETGALAPAHLFIGLFRGAQEIRERSGSDLAGWAFDDSLGPALTVQPWGPNVLIEMLCAGSHGRVIGYERVDGRVSPRLTSDENTRVLEWGLGRVHDIAAEVAAKYERVAVEADVEVDLGPLVLELIKMFWLAPTREEVVAWGAFPWEEEIWPPFNPVAQRVTTRDVLRRLSRGERRIRRHNSWRAGSALASPQPWRALIERSNAKARRAAGDN